MAAGALLTGTALPAALAAYGTCVAALLGACAGSFLDCAAWRAARGESALRGRSRCPACGRVLGARDLVPVFSYLLLRGRCRRCGAPIGKRCLLSELLCAALFALSFLRFGLSWRLAEQLVFTAVLFYLALSDLETMELPGLPMVLAAVSWLCFLPSYAEPLVRLRRGAVGALAVPLALLLLSLLMDRLLGKESLGGGDLKLLAVTGLYLGWDGNVLMLMLACVLGLALGAALRARGRAFPFGPALAAAAYLTALFGEPALSWYWGLL